MNMVQTKTTADAPAPADPNRETTLMTEIEELRRQLAAQEQRLKQYRFNEVQLRDSLDTLRTLEAEASALEKSAKNARKRADAAAEEHIKLEERLRTGQQPLPFGDDDAPAAPAPAPAADTSAPDAPGEPERWEDVRVCDMGMPTKVAELLNTAGFWTWGQIVAYCAMGADLSEIRGMTERRIGAFLDAALKLAAERRSYGLTVPDDGCAVPPPADGTTADLFPVASDQE